MTIKQIIENISYNPTNPDNIRLYHGTTFEGKDLICYHGGFKPDSNTTIWNCSEFNMTYFYELKRYAKTESMEDDSLYNIQYSILQRANEQGQIQEAILDNPHNYTYVLEFVLPPEAAQFISEDDSCENSKFCGSVQMNTTAINQFIETGNCTINVYFFDFFPKMAYFYIAGLKDNEYAQEYFDTLSKEESCAIDAINSADIYTIFETIVLEVEPKFEGYINRFDPNCYR